VNSESLMRRYLRSVIGTEPVNLPMPGERGHDGYSLWRRYVASLLGIRLRPQAYYAESPMDLQALGSHTLSSPMTALADRDVSRHINRARSTGRLAASMSLSLEFKLGIITSVLTVAAAGSAPWWWRDMPWGDGTAQPTSVVAGMSGGCAPFEAIAQNRYPPYGTAIHTQPSNLSTIVGTYAGNVVISVNGWVHGTADDPTKPPPWNSNVWFHLTDGAGWVSYPAVRAYPMSPDPSGLNPDGGPPVATSQSCEGKVQ
jgi:hypothetical protein